MIGGDMTAIDNNKDCNNVHNSEEVMRGQATTVQLGMIPESYFCARILTNIWSKLQWAKAKMKDIEHEFIGKKNELLKLVCNLTKQLNIVDLLLIRSQSESEFATLMSKVERLRSLNKI